MSRNWQPCRVCGREHHNPSSSSICEGCGIKEREERLAVAKREHEVYKNEPFSLFMSLSEEERWRRVFELVEEKETEKRLRKRVFGLMKL